MSRLSDIFSKINSKFFYLYIFIGLFAITVIILRINLNVGILFAGLPIAFLAIYYFFKYPYWLMMVLFVANYIIMGLGRYILKLQGGIVIDSLLLMIIITLFLRTVFFNGNYWQKANNALTYLSLIWMIYCIAEVMNPYTTIERWMTAVRGIGFYLFLFVLLTTALLNRYKDLKRILILWGILTILAVLKAMSQKFMGFDSAETFWLYVGKGYVTHIIYSGVRYFSFFTDAANFGCSMGLSMVVFSISALYIKDKHLRIYFIIVALLAGYGMLISGTRAALAVPFVGYTAFIILSKRIKMLIGGAVLILSVFIFFNSTDIGGSNANIRRMRTAFDTQDASLNVRFRNQQKMREFMPHNPFGIGIGKAKNAEDGDHMYGIATDSSLIYIWVETGIVGLVMYIFIFLFVLIRGTYDIFFRIKNIELKGILSALVAGLAGMLVTGYGNEVLQQFPTGPILYILMAFIMMGRYFDKEIENQNTNGAN
ncbi:MAG: O-antigen ligase family protein [Prevotella sp.]|jgi:hypothetical protein|nr:O-antigen ligase family protein [Prevotella sp.]